ncbi:hypothetical protein [Proteus terrae]|uniref:hypothetical protein n=1 Tax=Proteus terrae TaxID=1574161 RepID=UPI0034D6C268
MSNQNLEVLVNALSVQVVQQEHQIAELQKQLASMQLTSCELDVINKELRKNALLIESLKLTITSTKDKL